MFIGSALNIFTRTAQGDAPAPAADPPFVAGVGTEQFGLGDITLAWPTHIADDIGFMVIESANQTVPTPSGWAIAGSSPQAGGTVGGANGYMLSVFTKLATSGAEANVTITDIGDHIVGVIITVRGADGLAAIHASAGSITAPTTNPFSMPQVTTLLDNELELHLLAPRIDSATPVISNFASADGTATQHLNVSVAAGNGGGLGIYSVVKATAGLIAVATFDTTDATLPVPRIVYAISPPEPDVMASIGTMEIGSTFMVA